MTDKDTGFPIIVYEKVLGVPKLFRFWMLIEDRRPDLTSEEAKTRLGYKYKTQIKIDFMFTTYSYIFRHLYRGSRFINGSEEL